MTYRLGPRVRVNSLYTYKASGFDRFDPKAPGIPEGAVVRVVNLHGCPKANTMGQCYVADPESGRFIGMVDCHSLTPKKAEKSRS